MRQNYKLQLQCAQQSCEGATFAASVPLHAERRHVLATALLLRPQAPSITTCIAAQPFCVIAMYLASARIMHVIHRGLAKITTRSRPRGCLLHQSALRHSGRIGMRRRWHKSVHVSWCVIGDASATRYRALTALCGAYASQRV